MTSHTKQGLHKRGENAPSKTVGLISDTHIPSRAKRIPPRVFAVFEDVDCIIHAGDLVDMSVLDELEQLAPVHAVYGNMDRPSVRGKLSKTNCAKILGWKIGVMHNPGIIFGTRRMREIATENGFSVLVYGHTHRPNAKHDAGKLFINPGSPTNPIPPYIAKPTVALLRISQEGLTPEIVPI